MFAKLHTVKYLKMETSPDWAMVGFVGRVSQIARVHQEGLRDRVKPRGLEVRYPQRELLGLTAREIEQILDMVLNHL